MRPGHEVVPNIGPGEQRKRRLMGMILLVVSLGVVGTLLALDSPRWWRGTVFLPLWGSMLGFFQARRRT
jgi:hypothetical protein